MIMVDELAVWTTRGIFARGSCHLMTDGPIEELHEFAARMGLRRSWFQEHPVHPHYDLTPKRREDALRLGAMFVSAKEQARARMARVGLMKGVST